jgi:uncharacterized membrane protein YtjA (UPF0391 family)
MLDREVSTVLGGIPESSAFSVFDHLPCDRQPGLPWRMFYVTISRQMNYLGKIEISLLDVSGRTSAEKGLFCGDWVQKMCDAWNAACVKGSEHAVDSRRRFAYESSGRDARIRPNSRRPSLSRRIIMLQWALIFLIIAIIAGVFGFAGIAGAATGIAKILFFIFLVIFLISLVFGMRVRT